MKFGILQRYPNLRRLSERASAYAALCRPFTLLGAFLSAFCMDITFSRLHSGGFSLTHAALLGLTLAFLQAGGQSMNQAVAEEVSIDRMNGKLYRPTVDGRLTLRQAQIASVVLYIMGVGIAFSLSTAYGLFAGLIAFFAVGYTLEPLRMKKRFILNNIWQGVARGMLPVVYVALAYPEYLSLAVPYGLVLAVWMTGMQTAKDFGDERGDRAHGIRTLPVVLGSQGALFFMAAIGGYAFILLNSFIYNLLPSCFIWANVLILPSVFIIYALNRGLKFSYGENNASWIGMYLTLSGWYILPVILLA